jgi:hypothetical protein
MDVVFGGEGSPDRFDQAEIGKTEFGHLLFLLRQGTPDAFLTRPRIGGWHIPRAAGTGRL